MPSPEKFQQTLNDFAVSPDVMEEIYQGFDGIVSKTPKRQKAAFFAQALSVMNKRLSKEQVQAILEANACCKSGARERNSKEFARVHASESIEKRLELISCRPYLNMGRAELDSNGFLIVHGVSYRPGDKFECACPTVSKIKRDDDIPREYCYCCGGHFKYHYEIMLGVKLEMAEILSSPHGSNGAEPCVFNYRIV